MDERAEQQLLGVVDRAAMRTCIVDRTFISLPGTTDGSVTTRCIRGAPCVSSRLDTGEVTPVTYTRLPKRLTEFRPMLHVATGQVT